VLSHHESEAYDWYVSRSNDGAVEQTNSAASGFPPEILLTVDRSRRQTLSEQLRQQLRVAIHQGRLVPGTVLPPSRVMARDLAVSRSVVVQAYELLAADGYVSAHQGSSTRVLQVHSPAPDQPAPLDEPDSMIRFVSGLPDPRLFPRTQWTRHYRAALAGAPNRQFRYPGPYGAAVLREELASYLSRVRGVVATPDRVLVSGGITQALTLLCRALSSRGIRRIAVEDPCFGVHREAIRNAGMRPVPIPVDDDGLDVHCLPDEVGAVLVAPAHSYPTGSVLSAARRTALIQWANAREALVVEDDYDAEFRYDRAAVAALQGLSPERVVYCGGVSKMLTPALRLGWMVLPRRWIGEVGGQKVLDDMGTTVFEQLALAQFMHCGDFSRHLRRVRPIYRRRRDAAIQQLAQSLPATRAIGIDAGLHVYVELPEYCDEQGLVHDAAAHGLLIEGARHHFSEPATRPALVLGYGSLNESQIRQGIAALGEIYTGRRADTKADCEIGARSEVR
jgi:GntR family transcriptional regulator / MocR family aminotransferase